MKTEIKIILLPERSRRPADELIFGNPSTPLRSAQGIHFGKINTSRPKGFAALLIILVGVAVAVAVGLGFNILGLGELQLGFFQSQSSAAFEAADGCIEEALLRLKRDGSYTGGTLSVGSASCSVVVTGAGSSRTIIASSTVEGLTREIRVDATLSGRNITVNEWREVSD